MFKFAILAFALLSATISATPVKRETFAAPYAWSVTTFTRGDSEYKYTISGKRNDGVPAFSAICEGSWSVVEQATCRFIDDVDSSRASFKSVVLAVEEHSSYVEGTFSFANEDQSNYTDLWKGTGAVQKYGENWGELKVYPLDLSACGSDD